MNVRNALLLGSLWSAAGCATAPSAPPVSANAALAGPMVLPAWAAPEPAVSARSVAMAPPQEVVRIVETPAESPLDALLRARGGGRRLRAVNLRDTPAGEALRLFADVGRFNVVFSDEASAARVNLDLRDVSVASAFRAVLRVAHLDADVFGAEVVEVHARRAQQ